MAPSSRVSVPMEASRSEYKLAVFLLPPPHFEQLLSFFRCKSTGKWVQCPNGDPVDFNLGTWEQFAGCRVEDW